MMMIFIPCQVPLRWGRLRGGWEGRTSKCTDPDHIPYEDNDDNDDVDEDVDDDDDDDDNDIEDNDKVIDQKEIPWAAWRPSWDSSYWEEHSIPGAPHDQSDQADLNIITIMMWKLWLFDRSSPW